MNYKSQLQIRLLYAHSNLTERKELDKYLKPLPEQEMTTKQCTEPQHIREILPVVMIDIQQRMKKLRVLV